MRFAPPMLSDTLRYPAKIEKNARITSGKVIDFGDS